MSYKVWQLSPLSTRSTNARIPIAGRWSSLPANSQDAKFLRSWLVYDSDLGEGVPEGGVNWSSLLGIGLALALSLGFWAGLGVVVAEVWK
jgi:hypothetical protein